MVRGSSSTPLPDTLAQRVQFLRERRMMTPALLAFRAQVPLHVVEDIEAGIETFLAPAVRQRLARVLHVRSVDLAEVEKQLDYQSPDTPSLQQKSLDLRNAILQAPQAEYACPSCQAPLAIRLFERRDLQDNLLQVIKAHCTQCLFRLTDD